MIKKSSFFLSITFMIHVFNDSAWALKINFWQDAMFTIKHATAKEKQEVGDDLSVRALSLLPKVNTLPSFNA